MPPRGEEVDPSFSIRGRGEPLGGVPLHGLLRGWWPTTGGAHDVCVQTVPHGGEAQATEAVSDELETPKDSGFAKGEAIA
jgi:hypothetical protein